MDVINDALETENIPEITLQQAIVIMSFIPGLNIVSAIILIYWFVCTPKY